MEQVSRHVYVDPSYGMCTVGAIKTPKGVVLVDSPNQPTRAKRWLQEVEELGEVLYLINTEPHPDHIFGNAFLPGTVIAHRETKERFWEDNILGTSPLKDPKGLVEKIDPEGLKWVDTYRAKEPEISFEGRLRLSLGDMVIELFALPGHIPAETVVYVPGDKILFTSDNVFRDAMTWYHEALPFEWLETLDFFKQMDVEVVVPGHGPPGGPEILDEMKRVVQDAIHEVEAAIGSGLSREEAMDRITFIHRQPVPKEWQSYASTLQPHFVGRVYDQIQARRS